MPEVTVDPGGNHVHGYRDQFLDKRWLAVTIMGVNVGIGTLTDLPGTTSTDENHMGTQAGPRMRQESTLPCRLSPRTQKPPSSYARASIVPSVETGWLSWTKRVTMAILRTAITAHRSAPPTRVWGRAAAPR